MEVDENIDKKTKEECYICGHLCNPRRMLSHIRSHTNVEIHECEVCLERFSTKKSLHKHYISHSTHYICVHCNKKFVDPILLKQHECHDDERITFTCDICGKQFYQKSRLDKHLISHAEKQHICDCCGKSFRHKGNLTAHYRIHYKGEDGQYVKSVLQEKHECEECKKRFVSKRNLQRHYLCHTNEKPYMCEICNKYFAHKHNMESHLRLHFDNNKPYVCEICGKDFNRKYNLKVHYIMHNRKETGEAAHKIQKEKTFVCSICCKAFISKRNHDRHQVTHTKEKPYECELCDMKFAYDSTLKRHTYLHFGGYDRKKKRSSDLNGIAVDDNADPEEKPRVCNVCNVYFENKLEFRNHIRMDKQYGMYKCCICDQIFKVKKGLKEHQKIHTSSAENQPIVCIIKAEPEEILP